MSEKLTAEQRLANITKAVASCDRCETDPEPAQYCFECMAKVEAERDRLAQENERLTKQQGDFAQALRESFPVLESDPVFAELSIFGGIIELANIQRRQNEQYEAEITRLREQVTAGQRTHLRMTEHANEQHERVAELERREQDLLGWEEQAGCMTEQNERLRAALRAYREEHKQYADTHLCPLCQDAEAALGGDEDA